MSTTRPFSHRSLLPHSRAEVAAWYARSGTVQRLAQDWSTTVLREPTRSLQPGSRTTLLLGAPWAQSLLPQLPLGLNSRAGVRWEARHTDYQPGAGFTDVMDSGPLAEWTHHHRFLDDAETSAGSQPTSFVEDEVHYRLPSALANVDRVVAAARRMDDELERIMAFRARNTAADMDFHERLTQLPGFDTMTIIIAGASGLVGTQLSALLRSGGHRVITLVRRSGRSHRIDNDHISWDPVAGDLDPQLLLGADVVINLAGQPIARPFTPRHRAEVYASRMHATSTLVSALSAAVNRGGPHTLVNASASGYYGHDASPETTDAPPLAEDAPSGSDFLAAVCRSWENTAQRATDDGVRVVTVRTGLVMTARGGLLGAQLPLYWAGAGGPLGSGQMWQPWVSLNDLVQIYVWAAANRDLSGPINAVSPSPIQQHEFAETLADVVDRPSAVPTPGFAPSLLLGPQGSRELALSSARLAPQALLESGYTFRDTELRSALRHTLGR